MKDIIIYGFGGFARELAWLIDEANQAKREWNILGFIDDNEQNKGKEQNGYKVLGGMEWFEENKKVFCTIGVGNGVIREQIVQKIKDKVLGFPMIIHPDARVSTSSAIGEGSIICAGCVITVNTEIKDFVIINLNCTIGHDAVLDDYAVIAPGVHISGNVEIGKYTDIGTGATVIQGVKIGAKCVVGASAAVIGDIPANCTAVGVPAKIIKER